MYGLAFVFGPAAGGMLMRWEPWLTVRVALAATALNVFVLLFLPEPPGSGKPEAGDAKAGAEAAKEEKQKKKANGTGAGAEEQQKQQQQCSLWALAHGGAGSTVAVLLGRKLCTSFAGGLFETTFSEYVSRHLGLHGHVLGLLLSYLGVLSVLNKTLIIRFLSQRFENAQLLLPAILGQTAALLMWSYVHDTVTLCAVLAALSVSSGLFQTLLSAELSKATPHELIGSTLGVSYALETGAKILTPPLGGYLLNHRGPHALGMVAVLFLLPCLANVALDTVRSRRREGAEQLQKKVQ